MIPCREAAPLLRRHCNHEHERHIDYATLTFQQRRAVSSGPVASRIRRLIFGWICDAWPFHPKSPCRLTPPESNGQKRQEMMTMICESSASRSLDGNTVNARESRC